MGKRTRPSSVQSRKVGGKSAQPILVRKNSKKDQSNIASDLSNFPRSEIKLTKMLMDKPAPPVSFWTWVILDRKSKKVLFGRLEKDRREVASLTKIMTLYTVLSIVDALKISLSTQVEITQTASEVIGTSACLVAGDTLTLNELLYGMMLPSGNDAAHMLASYLGSVLLDHYEANKMTREQIENYTISGVPVDHNQQIQSLAQMRSKGSAYVVKRSQYKEDKEICAFLAEMNRNCVKLNLKASFFDSPHGLMNQLSRSTAFDVAKLSATCLEDERVRRIVSTYQYKVPKTKENKNSKTYRWENTHRMIG